MRFLVGLGVLLVAACVSPDAQMKSWEGRTEAQLIQSWGPPTARDSDGAGGQVLTYSQAVAGMSQPGTIKRTYNGNYEYTAPGQVGGYERVRQFYVNPDGIIYRWRWQGY